MRIAVTILLFAVLSATAQDDREEIAGQKAAIAEAMKKLKLKPAATIETGDLLVAAALPEAKAKAVADAAQRSVSQAREALQYAKDDALFPGRLTLYVFAEHGELKSFVRQVELRRPEADAFSNSLRGKTPHVAVSPDAGAKPNDAELTAAAATWAAAAVLTRKAGVVGTPLPHWLQVGFGRACHLRGEPAAKQSVQRQKIKTAVTKSKTPVWAKDLWGDARLADRDLVAGSVVEFLAFGPYAEKFPAFARATMPPADSDQAPNMDEALKVFELKAEDLDYQWKAWVVKGK